MNKLIYSALLLTVCFSQEAFSAKTGGGLGLAPVDMTKIHKINQDAVAASTQIANLLGEIQDIEVANAYAADYEAITGSKESLGAKLPDCFSGKDCTASGQATLAAKEAWSALTAMPALPVASKLQTDLDQLKALATTVQADLAGLANIEKYVTTLNATWVDYGNAVGH